MVAPRPAQVAEASLDLVSLGRAVQAVQAAQHSHSHLAVQEASAAGVSIPQIRIRYLSEYPATIILHAA